MGGNNSDLIGYYLATGETLTPLRGDAFPNAKRGLLPPGQYWITDVRGGYCKCDVPGGEPAWLRSSAEYATILRPDHKKKAERLRLVERRLRVSQSHRRVNTKKVKFVAGTKR